MCNRVVQQLSTFLIETPQRCRQLNSDQNEHSDRNEHSVLSSIYGAINVYELILTGRITKFHALSLKILKQNFFNYSNVYSLRRQYFKTVMFIYFSHLIR